MVTISKHHGFKFAPFVPHVINTTQITNSFNKYACIYRRDFLLYARVDLSKTNYVELDNYNFIKNPNIQLLNNLYKKYCQYKKFCSVMPIFDSEYTDPSTDVIGYYDNNILVAFSLIKRYSNTEAECVQFAWDYVDPELRLGISSLKNECAVYKRLGFRYLYLGGADEYKKDIDGFEILGPA